LTKTTIPPEQLSAEVQALCNVLNDSPDVACVVVSAAFLNSAMRMLLDKSFVRSEKVNSLLNSPTALRSYAVRNDLLYSLGVIDDWLHSDLETLGKIRNEVAHSHIELSFGEPKISDLCSELLGWKQVFPSKEDREPSPAPDSKQFLTVARNKFILSVLLVANRLIMRGLSLQRE